MPAYNNPFAQFLEDQPEAGYFSYQNQWRTPNQKRYFQSQFSDIQNRYMGQLGQMIRGGQDPNLQFMDFLGNFNWGQEFQQGASPAQRGQDTSRYNPWARWMV